MNRLTKGENVRVRLQGDGDWCEAVVELASDTDPQSVALRLDGGVRERGGGLLAGILPLTISYAGETVTSLFGDEYEIEVQSKEEGEVNE